MTQRGTDRFHWEKTKKGKATGKQWFDLGIQRLFYSVLGFLRFPERGKFCLKQTSFLSRPEYLPNLLALWCSQIGSKTTHNTYRTWCFENDLRASTFRSHQPSKDPQGEHRFLPPRPGALSKRWRAAFRGWVMMGFGCFLGASTCNWWICRYFWEFRVCLVGSLDSR